VKLTFRALIILSFLLSSLPGLASEPWQQWRIDASSDPDKWLETSQQWIETYDSQRDFSKLAMAYALRAEALRYSGNEDQVQSTIEEGLRFANIADDPVATALLRINQGWYFLQRGILNRAAASASYAVEAAKTSGNSNLFIEAEILEAQVFHDSGDVARALEILESLEAEQRSDLPRLQLEFHSLIGAIYLDVGATGIALEHIRDAYEIARDALGAWDRSVAEYNLARAYARTGELSQAREFFEQALQTSRSINDGLGVAYAQMRLAEIEHQQGNNDIALTLLDKTLPDFRDAAAHPMEAQSLLLKAEILLAEARLTSAKDVIDTTQSLINTLQDVTLKQRLYEIISDYHQQQGNDRQALEAYKTSVDYLLQEQAALQNKQIQEIMVRLEIREQEATNELLQKENQLQQLQLQEQQTSNYLMLWLLFSGAAIVLLISYFLYQQMRSRRRYAELALKDDLTGAPNRRAVVRHCKLGLEQVRQKKAALALAIIDFDYFKQVNDSFGHDVGDAVLKRFADVTQQCLRRQDHFGRMGGEEWLLVLFDASENDAELIFSRILNRMNEVEIKGLPRDYRVTFSMGFAEATADDTFERLYKRADDVLYAAKERGRQRLQIAPLPPAQNG